MRFKSLSKNTTPLLSQVSNQDLSNKRLAHLCHKASTSPTCYSVWPNYLSHCHWDTFFSCSLFSSFLIFFSRAAEIIFSVAESHARHHGSSSFAVEQLYGLLTNARRNLGVFQHHDGITGTAKDFVVVDYATRCAYVRTCGRPSLFNSAVSRAFLRRREDLRRVGEKLQGSGTYNISPKPLVDLSPTRFALKNLVLSRGQRYARSKALIMRFCS